MKGALRNIIADDRYAIAVAGLLILLSVPAIGSLAASGMYDFTVSAEYTGYMDPATADKQYDEFSEKEQAMMKAMMDNPSTSKLSVDRVTQMKDGMTVAYNPDGDTEDSPIYTIDVEKRLRIAPLLGVVGFIAGLMLVADCIVCLFRE